MMDENTMTITDENGLERQVEILLTFDDNNGKSFVLFTDPEEEEGNVYAYSYTEDGEMDEVTEEEWEMCQEVLGAFIEEEDHDNNQA